MCGICGFNWEDGELVGKMAAALAHRGPDQDGIFVAPGVSLGHKRLSIIDLSEAGRQPMFSDDRRLCIVFNGEIYNFQEIRERLETKGHTFRSRSDTEVILHAYDEYGHACVKEFNGDFAFAIWDSREKELFLARDRLGIKPMYYFSDGKRFIFASEIKAILTHGIPRELNERCLMQLIAYAYPINGETMLKGIVELLPGHTLSLREGRIHVEQYWDIQVAEADMSEEEHEKNVESLLLAAVKRRLMSDVPLGISLSGGIDSSLIVAMASTLSTAPVHTFHVGVDTAENEFAHARKVAEHCGTDHTEIHLEYADFTRALAKVIWHLEIPVARPAVLPVFYLSNKIRETLTVSLCGEGADELFAGYNRYDLYTRPPSRADCASEQEYEALMKKISLPIDEKIARVSSGVFIDDKEEFFVDTITRLPADLQARHTFGPFLKSVDSNGQQLNQALRYELKTEIPYFHCNKLDKTGMSNSHEIRVPYLDHTLVEYAMTIPSKFKFQGSRKKIILQRIAKRYLPDEIVNRKKLPLVMPLKEYFENEFITIAERILAEPRLRLGKYYKKDRIKKLLADIRGGNDLRNNQKVTVDNAYRQAFFLVTLELWYRMFIESEGGSPSLDIESYL